MGDDHAKTLLDWYGDLKTQRLPYEPEWREQMEFIRPNARKVSDLSPPGQRQTQRLYDTTAPDACRKLANYLNGVVTSASTRWQSLVTRDPELMRDREVALWLDDASTRLHMAYQQSNFKAAFAQAYESLVAHGVTAVYLEERDVELPGFNGFRYYTVPVGQFVIARNGEGQADVFMRRFQLTAKAAEAKFGRHRLSDKIQKTLDNKPYERFAFIHAIYPTTTGRWAYESCYVEEEAKNTVLESGYEEIPVFVATWMLEEGEIYGKGPGHLALPDVRTLNVSKKLGLEALSLMVRPPLQVPHDGIVGGQVRLTPAAINTVHGDGKILPIELGGDLKSEMVKGEELRQQIKSCFHRDLVALPDKNYMTATEIVKQLDLVNRELGPTLGQIEHSLLAPHATRSFGILYRTGGFLPPPEALAGQELDVEYEGPLARTQRAGDLSAQQSALVLVAGLAEQDPEAMDLLDTDENVRYAWEVSGNPMRLLRAPGKVQQIREARAQTAQQQAQIQQAQGMMDVAATGATAGKTMKEADQLQGTA